jgi:dTDP-4-amino-4,6-dideoxygalactose transaminase
MKGGYLVKPRIRVTPNHHLFAIVFRTGDQRDRFIAHMKAHDIIAPFHYVALHLSPMGRRYHEERPLPVSERLTACLVRLPLYFNMTDREQDEVIGRAQEFIRGI